MPWRRPRVATYAGLTLPVACLIEIDARSLFMNLECPQAFHAATREFLTEIVAA